MKFKYKKIKVMEALEEYNRLYEQLNIWVRQLQGKCLHTDVVIAFHAVGNYGSFDEIRMCTSCGLTTTWSHGDSLRIFKKREYPKISWDELIAMRDELLGPTRAGIDRDDKPG